MTKIEWVARPGTIPESWNPITGCTKVSEGCRNCYAERMARRLAGRYGYPESPHQFDVTLHPDRLSIPSRWRKPRTIFCVSMGDLFHPKAPFGFVDKVMRVVAENPRHTFLILTKRSERMFNYFYGENILDIYAAPCMNLWLGVSVENQKAADERRNDFEQTSAAIKFVSYEPALGPVDWTGWEFVDQIISGGESGPKARPSHPDWHGATRDFCQENGIAYFFKQNGEWLPGCKELLDEGYGKIWAVCPKDQNDKYPQIMWRVGKRRAGRLLDGKEWGEWPE